MKKFPDGIVVFRFSQNECYTQVSQEHTDQLKVDLEARTWVSWRGVTRPFGVADVPSRDYCRANMVIGVYDVRDFAQLQKLLHDASTVATDGARGAIYVD